MASNAKPRKKYKPRPVSHSRLVNQQNRFRTIEIMLAQLETGELLEADGKLMYYEFEENGYHELIPAFGGWLIYVANLAGSSRVKAHEQLYRALENDKLIEPSLLEEVRQELIYHKQAYMQLTPVQARNLAIKTRIMIQQQNITALEAKNVRNPEGSTRP